jgi:asparagine synthase (glutamine-hydrolysing)
MEWGFVASSDARRLCIRMASPHPAGSGRPLLSVAQSADYVVLLLGRLYYRADALESLAHRAPPLGGENAHENDAALTLWAYAEFGDRGLVGLEGDFCLLVFDRRKRVFVARRDPLGAYPLFWTRVGATTVVATAMDAIVEHLPDAVVSQDFLANFLMDLSHADRRARQTCVYEGVTRVTTDEIVTLDVVSGEVSGVSCWDWRDHIVDPGSDRPEDMARRYAPALRAAVRERIGAHNAAHMSGGVDSTAVCLLALDCVNGGAAEPPLHALSLVYQTLPILAQERPFIDLVLDSRRPGLVAHRVDGDDILHFDLLSDPPPHDEPYAGLWALESDRALTAEAAKCGADTLLTGEGADDFMHVSAERLSDLVASGRWLAAWRSACDWAQVHRSNPWTELRRHGFSKISARGSRGLLSRILRGSRSHAAETASGRAPAWVSQDFAHRNRLEERAVAAASRLSHRRGESVVLARAYEGLDRRSAEGQRSILGAPSGVHFAHPFLDQRLVGLGLGVQCRLQRPSTLRKPVLAAAMRGVLPEPIRTRPMTQPFNELLYLGYRRNQDKLRRLIQNSPVDAFGMFDKRVMIDCLEGAALGVATPFGLRRLNQSLSLLAWRPRKVETRSRATIREIVVDLRSGAEIERT